MVAEDHRHARTEVFDQTRLLVEIQRHAFVIVIADVTGQTHGVLRDRQETMFLRGDTDAGGGMRVDHAVDLRAAAMHGAMNHIAGLIDTQARRIINDFTLGGDLDQIRGGDFVPQQAESVNQKVMLFTGHARRDMRVDEVGHTKVRSQPVTGGEIDAHLPLLRADAAVQRRHAQWIDHRAHAKLLCFIGAGATT